MKVILLDEIKGKGGEGDVVEVAQGYAENFLFPKKLAVAATKGNLKQLDERRNNIAKREAVRLATANETKAAFEGKTVTVDVKVGDEGILFGSVTAAMIADAIKAQLGMDIDRKRVELGKPIKVAGAHTVAISLYREIKAEVVVLVGVTAEHDVGTTAGHVGGHGDGSLAAGDGDHGGFLLMLLGVQDLVRDPVSYTHLTLPTIA